MDLITLGRTLGFSFAAGVNLYATVAILGLAARFEWVTLPPQFQTFNNDVIIGQIPNIGGVFVLEALKRDQCKGDLAASPRLISTCMMSLLTPLLPLTLWPMVPILTRLIRPA